MTTLLQLKTSLFAENSQSNQLSDAFVRRWQDAHPGARTVIRDLAAAPVPHLDQATFQAFLTPTESRDTEQSAHAARSDALIAELQAADVLVIGLPMYNFGVPSTLKAYFDHVARAGITFRYSEHGPQGLLSGKKAYVVATRGGRYAGTPLDTQSDFMRQILGFLGITEVEFIYAEGLSMGGESKTAGLAEAHVALARLAA